MPSNPRRPGYDFEGATRAPDNAAERGMRAKYGLFALGGVAALVFAMVWNPPTGSVHSFSRGSDYRSERESGCTNSGKGCHGSETAYTDFNVYHPNATCTTCHEYQGVGCIPCHTPAENECPACHDGTFEPAGDRVRLSDPYPRGHYRETTHTAMGTDMRAEMAAAEGGEAAATCGDCHSRDLTDSHTGVKPVKDSPYGDSVGCGECHNDTRALGQKVVLADWKQRKCEDCHGENSSADMHPTDVAEAVEGPSELGCGETGVGCHDSSDLHGLHGSAPKKCSGSAATGEPGCHDLKAEAAVPPKAGCGAEGAQTCHSTYVNDDYSHEKDRDLHSPENRLVAADSSYYDTACGECHLAEPDGTSLIDEHARSTSAMSGRAGENCQNCHEDPASAEAITSDWPDAATRRACDACHGTRGLSATHSGDVGGLHAAEGSAGCAASGPGCHPTGDLSEVGAPTPAGNIHRDCVRCHDATPSGGNVAWDPNADSCGSARACHDALGAYEPSTGVHDGSAGRTDGLDSTYHTAGAQQGRGAIQDDATGVVATCDECHGLVLGAEHARPNSAIASGKGTLCVRCHNANPTASSVAKSSWDRKTTVYACAACHGDTAASQHSDTATAHKGIETPIVGANGPQACSDADCHGSRDLRILHRTNGCTNQGCHSARGDIFGLGITSCGGSDSRTSCHVNVHSDINGDGANHTAGPAQAVATYKDPATGASVACSTCHGMSLATEHTRSNSVLASGAGTVCSRCHQHSDTTRSVVTKSWPQRTTEKACAECHSGAGFVEPHSAISTAHLGAELSPAGVQTAGACVRSGCHTTPDLRVLHKKLGCTNQGCHAATGNILGLALKTCGGTDDARACHAGFSATDHKVDHSADLTGTVNGITYVEGANVGCFGCHERDLDDEHSEALLASMDGGSASACRACHANDADAGTGDFASLATIAGAIANHDRRCLTCHASGSDADGPDAVASAHKRISTETVLPGGTVWSDPRSDWKAAFESTTGGGHNALSAGYVGASQTKDFPVTTFTVDAVVYRWPLVANSGATLWLRPSVYATATAQSTYDIQHLRVTCEDCHDVPASAAGPQGAAVTVTIDSTYSQTEYANPTDGTFQFDPYNLDPAHPANPAGYKPVICYKCHTTFSGSVEGTLTPGGHRRHSTHKYHRTGVAPNYVYTAENCIDCHTRIPHAWKRPRMLTRTATSTVDSIAPDQFPYVPRNFDGLTGIRLKDIATANALSPGTCGTNGCYAAATASHHPRPSMVPTATYWP